VTDSRLLLDLLRTFRAQCCILYCDRNPAPTLSQPDAWSELFLDFVRKWASWWLLLFYYEWNEWKCIDL